LIDPRILDFANEVEAQHINAFLRHGTFTAAGDAIEVHRSTIQRSIERVKMRAAAHGYSPDHGLESVVPAPFIAKGHSTLERVSPDGSREQVLQWTKTKIDDTLWMEHVKEGINAFLQGAPKVLAPHAPLDFDTDIIPWIQIGDAHIGMLAHAAEVGENFDLKIAETELCGAFSILIDELPNCERLVINDLGDFTHYENFSAKTEASGHDLDFDSRFPKMIKVYSRIMRWLVDKALTKARHVDVIVNQGNHSRTNDIWMAELLRVCYGHTGRVHVLNNDSVFIGYRMGNTFVMTHHSDKCRPNRLAHVMTTDFRQDYGETEFHYIDIGHVHHSMVVKEHPGVVVESFNNLAAMDKYAFDNGYRSKRSMTTILRSRRYGEIGRRTLPIQEVRERLNRAIGFEIPKVQRAYAV
jgi:hypothetical protein